MLEDMIICVILLAIVTEFLWIVTSVILQLLNRREKAKKAKEDTKYIFRSQDFETLDLDAQTQTNSVNNPGSIAEPESDLQS